MENNKLESLSKELKAFLAKYRMPNALGHLSFLMTCITNGIAQNELGKLVSPMRQLYYLAGLIVTQKDNGQTEFQFLPEDWQRIVDWLVQIENEYYQMFLPESSETITDEWKEKVAVAMPTFLSYFNLGPLNYEEQLIEQIKETFSSLDDVIVEKLGLTTDDFLLFYDNLDSWCQYNFQSLGQISNVFPLRPNWEDYTDLEMNFRKGTPKEIKAYMRERAPMQTLVVDPGIKYRFKSSDLASNGLTEEKIRNILSLLAIQRKDNEFLYYTGQNPLIIQPIVDLGDGLFQVFEEKRVLHAILYHLEEICKEKESPKSRLVHYKGVYLESKIIALFRKFLRNNVEIITNYFIDGCEQDIMVLWKNYMFVIEAKAYNNREPFRNTEKAFTRIKDDFNRCIGYAHKQTKRVEEKIKEGKSFDLLDKDSNVIKTINPVDYEENDFYIIVNQESFGQIQVDLSNFLEIGDDDKYPWAVRYDDLEVFLLTLIAMKKKPDFFIDFLIFREYLHGHIICSDEGEICGGFLTGALTQENAESSDLIVCTPNLASVFDEQYRKGMGFKNEKHWKEKHDGKTVFWG